MHIIPVIQSINKYVNRGICDNISDSNFNESIYKSSLLLGLEGYRNYTQAAKMLNISTNHLRVLISKNKIQTFHRPIMGQCKWLSLQQIEDISKLIGN